MIEVLPYMLIIFGYNPETEEFEFQRQKMLFETSEFCESVGETTTGFMNRAAEGRSGTVYTFRCVNVPSSDEYHDIRARTKLDGQ